MERVKIVIITKARAIFLKLRGKSKRGGQGYLY
jgi:hypothetical protein